MRFLSPKVLIISVIQIALTVVLLVALARLLDPAKLRQLLQAANPVWLTVGIVILTAQQIISAERWRLVAVALSAPQYRMWFYLFWQGLSMSSNQTGKRRQRARWSARMSRRSQPS